MNYKKLIYDVFRITLGIVFLSSGIGKFYGTSGIIGPGWLFEELSKYNLLFFAIFIAIAEIVIGYLLLVKRFSTIGAVLLFPMIVNILVIVISLEWQGTPVVDSVFLTMNIYLLYYDRAKLFPVLGLNASDTFGHLLRKTIAEWMILLVIISGVLTSYLLDEKFRIVTRIGLFAFVCYGIYNFINKRKLNFKK